MTLRLHGMLLQLLDRPLLLTQARAMLEPSDQQP